MAEHGDEVGSHLSPGSEGNSGSGVVLLRLVVDVDIEIELGFSETVK
jgi:hypothetical protein